MNLIQSWLTRQSQLYYILIRVTVITDLAPQVAKANRGGPGAIKMTANKLTLNVKKTKCILIRSKFKLSQTDNCSVGRAPDCRAGGRRFKPRPDQHSGS